MTQPVSHAFDLVKQLNARARGAGVADSIEQFQNISTHAQYRTPYAVAARWIKRGDRVLDWGCGNGHFSLLLEQLGAKPTGYSFDDPPACMAASPSFRHVRGTVDDPRSIPFPPGSFDVVCSVGVLEHVWETGGDEGESLREIARVLEPGGLFLTFHLPNRTGWIEPTFRALGLNKHFHYRKYRAQEIRALWQVAGFEILEVGRYNALPRNQLTLLPAAIRRSEVFVRGYNAIDDLLAAGLPFACTNYFVVARRTTKPAAEAR